jgi:hypothetical protein
MMRKILRLIERKFLWHTGLGNVHDLVLNQYLAACANSTINPLLKPIVSSFSQSDEDGIIERITDRLNLTKGRFVEFGVGDGTENNTLNLLLNGWKGMWFGGESITIPKGCKLPDSLEFTKIWVDHNSLEESVIPKIKSAGDIDLISMDLDGNDYHFTKQLLESGLYPKIWIQEYNGNFAASVDWVQQYNPGHKWKQDAFFGASLLSFKKLFEGHGYRLIACNLTGINAFFVKKEYVSAFQDIPSNFSEIYQPAFPVFPKMKQVRKTSIFLQSNGS